MRKKTIFKQIRDVNRAVYIIALLALVSIILVTAFFKQNKTTQAGNQQGIVSGKVVDKEGTGIQNIVVELYDGNGNKVASTRTKTGHEAGEYEIDLKNLSTTNYNLKFIWGEKDSLEYNGLVYTLADVVMNKTVYKRIETTAREIKNVNIAFVLPHNYEHIPGILEFYREIKSELQSVEGSNIEIKVAQDILVTYEHGIMYINGKQQNNEPIAFASGIIDGGLNKIGDRNIIVVAANNNLNAWGDLDLRRNLNLGSQLIEVLPIIIDDNIESQFQNAGLECFGHRDVIDKVIIRTILESIGVEEGGTVSTTGFKDSQTQGSGINSPNQQDKNALVNLNSISDERRQELGDKYWRGVTTKTISTNDKVTINVILKKGAPLQDSNDYTNPSLETLTGTQLSGFVFSDNNGNGVCDLGEEIPAQIEVALYNSSGGLVKAGKTTLTGAYGFDGLEYGGKYKIEFTYGTLINTAGYDPLLLVNGQNYETTKKGNQNYSTGHNSNQNHATDVNRQSFNERFKTINNSLTRTLNGDNGNAKLINATKITAQTGIITIPELALNPDYEYDEETDTDNGEPEYIEVPAYVNLGLVKRPDVKVSLKAEVNAVKYKLVNGDVFISEVNEDNGQLESLFKKNGNVNGSRTNYDIQVDEELMHGATIEIEYLIKIKNETQITNPYFNDKRDDYRVAIDKIIDYLDFNNNAMLFREHIEMITETGNNTKYDWKILNLKNGSFRNQAEVSILDGEYMMQIPYLREAGQYIMSEHLKDTKIGINETKELKMSVSKVITHAMSSDQLSYGNAAEIIQYSNAAGRRITDINVMPGSYNNDPNRNQMTDDTAINVIIMPPLGLNNNWWNNIWESIRNIVLF